MDAVKFFKEKERMCKSRGEGCTGCMIHIKSHDCKRVVCETSEGNKIDAAFEELPKHAVK